MINSYKHFLFTQDPDILVKFYHDVLGFKIVKKLEYELDYGYTLELSNGQQIWLAKYSEVKGFNKEPFRTMLNLYSDSVKNDFDKAKNYSGVKVIQEQDRCQTLYQKKQDMFVHC